MSETHIEKQADKVISDVKELSEIKAGIQGVKTAWAGETNPIKKPLKAIAAGAALIADVVTRVEMIGTDLAWNGTDKKKLAVAIINRLVDLPLLNEAMEEMAIEFAIETIVAAFNRQFGKDWRRKVGL